MLGHMDLVHLKKKCTTFFGKEKGLKIWEAFNKCFDEMAVAAVIDNKIFCVHGGIPRSLQRNPKHILRDISKLPRGSIGTNEVLIDLLWSDPSTRDEEKKN